MCLLCRSLVETDGKDVLNFVDELKNLEVEKAHKQEEISWCGESRSSCVKILLKGIVATYDTICPFWVSKKADFLVLVEQKKHNLLGFRKWFLGG